jgi:hypothetical protein
LGDEGRVADFMFHCACSTFHFTFHLSFEMAHFILNEKWNMKNEKWNMTLSHLDQEIILLPLLHQDILSIQKITHTNDLILPNLCLIDR